MKKTSIFLLAGMTLLFSCSKNDDDPVTPPDLTKEAAQQLQQHVQGKWLFNADIELGRKAISSGGRKSQRSLMGRALPQLVETNGTTGTTGDVPGFIEFTSDSSYIIYDENQKVYTGKFEAKSGDSIVLSGIGYLTGITISNGKMDFKLFYTATSKTITIVANKAATIPVDDRTTLLTKGPWYITTEESGADMIGSEEWELDENGKEVYYIIDSVGFLISNNGTYLVQIFSGKKLKSASMANWKWHSKQSDKFVYAWDNEPFDEENNAIQINELTATRLKVTEAWDSNGDGIDDSTEKWVLKPAR